MKSDLPTSNVSRVLTGGRTAAKVSSTLLTYCAKRPFLSDKKKLQAKEKAAMESAQSLFQGLSLLKGTALKMAQLLSLEMDLLPEAACRELAKAYHQAPPINRALARKVVRSGLGRSPEDAFTHFEPTAFAAASLGQVHRATSKDGRPLAVKLQYPGIAQTIEGDVKMIRLMLRPLVDREHLLPTLDEIAARLREEVNYLQEAENLAYFHKNLQMDTIHIPRADPDLSSRTVLSTTMMPGKPLDLWLKDNPGQKERDYVAKQLNAMVARCLYELGVIHADPNPGNFIIADDLTIGVVDFGCIKPLNADFVEQYRQLAMAAAHNDGNAHFQLMIQLGLLPSGLDSSVMKTIKEFSDAFRHWFGQLFAEESFDFKANPRFIAEGQAAMRKCNHLRRHLKVNPDFIFLDRTRYGLLRIYEMMGAKVAFRNPYEW